MSQLKIFSTLFILSLTACGASTSSQIDIAASEAQELLIQTEKISVAGKIIEDASLYQEKNMSSETEIKTNGQSVPVEPVSQSAQDHDNGTRLGASTEITAPCHDQEMDFAYQGKIHTTGSVDSVIISAIIDQQEAIQVGIVHPQDFVHDGRNKSADYSVNIPLQSGQHQIILCFTQSGAQGRKPKQICTNAIDMNMTCDNQTQSSSENPDDDDNEGSESGSDSGSVFIP